MKGRVQESQSGRKQEGQLGGAGGAQVKSPTALSWVKGSHDGQSGQFWSLLRKQGQVDLGEAGNGGEEDGVGKGASGMFH